MRLIDADALQEKLGKWHEELDNDANYGTADEMANTAGAIEALECMLAEIEGTPTIEAEPVRHGRWERRTTPLDCECKCSECGYRDFVPLEEDYNHGYWFRRNFCPNCGAKM